MAHQKTTKLLQIVPLKGSTRNIQNSKSYGLNFMVKTHTKR